MKKFFQTGKHFLKHLKHERLALGIIGLIIADSILGAIVSSQSTDTFLLQIATTLGPMVIGLLLAFEVAMGLRTRYLGAKHVSRFQIVASVLIHSFKVCVVLLPFLFVVTRITLAHSEWIAEHSFESPLYLALLELIILPITILENAITFAGLAYIFTTGTTTHSIKGSFHIFRKSFALFAVVTCMMEGISILTSLGYAALGATVHSPAPIWFSVPSTTIFLLSSIFGILLAIFVAARTEAPAIGQFVSPSYDGRWRV